MKSEFSRDFSKSTPILNFIKLRPVGVELFHADGQTDGYDQTNSRFSQFYEYAQKNRSTLQRWCHYFVSKIGNKINHERKQRSATTAEQVCTRVIEIILQWVLFTALTCMMPRATKPCSYLSRTNECIRPVGRDVISLCVWVTSGQVQYVISGQSVPIIVRPPLTGTGTHTKRW